MRPLPAWLRDYDRAHLRGDLTAGATVAVMLVPQAMAYAMLAGLPPRMGLYASLLPLVVYALLGSSRQLAIGPAALDSLLVATGVGAIAAAGTDDFVRCAIALAAMVGALQLTLGAIGFGRIAALLSRPVVSGFTSGAAVVIVLSQTRHLLGVELTASSSAFTTAAALVAALPQTHALSLAIGVAAVLALVVLRRFRPRWPRALMVVAPAIALAWALDLESKGVAVVGGVAAGLPMPALPRISLVEAEALLPTALALALIGFTEVTSVGRLLGRERGEVIEPNRELRALGVANLAGSLLRGFPIAASFSRSAVNAASGARTPLASLVTGLIVALALLFLMPIFGALPLAVLSAIVVAAVARLVDVAELRRLWTVERRDALLMALTFAATLAFGIRVGLLTGVLASIAGFVLRSARPDDAVLGRMPDSTRYRDVSRCPEAIERRDVVVWRFDASLYFANAARFRRRVEGLAKPGIVAVVVDASGLNRIDASGLGTLRDVHRSLERRGTTLVLAAAKGRVRDALDRAELTEQLGGEQIFGSVHEAVVALARDGALEAASEGASEDAHEAASDEAQQGPPQIAG